MKKRVENKKTNSQSLQKTLETGGNKEELSGKGTGLQAGPFEKKKNLGKEKQKEATQPSLGPLVGQVHGHSKVRRSLQMQLQPWKDLLDMHTW